MPWIEINTLHRKPNWVVKSEMINSELSRICDQHAVGITLEEILAGKLDRFVDKGLRVFSMCNDGSGRSYTVEKRLNQLGIPSIRLKGGLKQFLVPENHENFFYAQPIINRVPNVAVILTLEERESFHHILSNLKAFRYLDSKRAIESLTRMELP